MCFFTLTAVLSDPAKRLEYDMKGDFVQEYSIIVRRILLICYKYLIHSYLFLEPYWRWICNLEVLRSPSDPMGRLFHDRIFDHTLSRQVVRLRGLKTNLKVDKSYSADVRRYRRNI